MIVASLLLILVAAVLLVLGLLISSSALLVVSIAASLVAATALLAATRLAAARGSDVLTGLHPVGATTGARDVPGDRHAAGPRTVLSEALVVVGRRHYHLPGCSDLAGEAVERLPLSEAEEAGLTACPTCEPDAVIFVDARRD